MTRNIPAVLCAVLAGVAVSISSGALLASYVVTDLAQTYAAPPQIAAADPITADDTRWPAPDPFAAVSGRSDTDQANGVLASGSSRL